MEEIYKKQVQPTLGMLVYHEDIYNGNEKMEVVGIRKTQVELRGDYSGGTHNVVQDDWHRIDGVFLKVKRCDNIVKYGSCPLPNVHCSHPHCEKIL